jgi:hypothetical protein
MHSPSIYYIWGLTQMQFAVFVLDSRVDALGTLMDMTACRILHFANAQRGRPGRSLG